MSAPSEPETLADLFTREARSERPALVDPSGREYDAHWLRTSAWKAGNFLRHTGVRRGVTVGVVGDGPIALLGAFGTALLEGRVWLDPPTALADAEDVRTLVAPLDDLEDYDLPPGGQQVGYGGKPTDPSVHHFDAGLWSENPSFPPVEFDPETPLLTDGSRTIDHRTILDAGAAFVDRIDLEAGDRVSIEAPLDDPRTIVLGVVAPLLADAVIELPTSDSPSTDGRGTRRGRHKTLECRER